LDGYIVDQGDAEGVPGKVHVAPTLMTSVADKEALARTVLSFADSLS
jgi:LPPG:FO 2-phospho-L-lactate transferase